ncbi:MAG: hypothetical protein ACE5IC_06240 [Candidatus Brocadiales bacterium]
MVTLELDIENVGEATHTPEITVGERFRSRETIGRLGIAPITQGSPIGNVTYVYVASSAHNFFKLDVESEEIIDLREVSKEIAKKEILELIEREPGIGFYEISIQLRLELGFVVEVCEELISEGKLSAGEPIEA